MKSTETFEERGEVITCKNVGWLIEKDPVEDLTCNRAQLSLIPTQYALLCITIKSFRKALSIP